MSDQPHNKSRTKSGFHRTISSLSIFSIAALSACSTPDPSVPTKSGADLQQAKLAVESCVHRAEPGANGALAGGYFAGVVLGGLIVGPIVVAANTNSIRANGAASAVDKCIASQGFERRELSPQEVAKLNSLSQYDRRRFLNHLVSGGTLETFS